MSDITFMERKWSYVREARLRPSMLWQLGRLGETPVYTEIRMANAPTAIYLPVSAGVYNMYRESLVKERSARW